MSGECRVARAAGNASWNELLARLYPKPVGNSALDRHSLTGGLMSATPNPFDHAIFGSGYVSGFATCTYVHTSSFTLGVPLAPKNGLSSRGMTPSLRQPQATRNVISDRKVSTRLRGKRSTSVEWRCHGPNLNLRHPPCLRLTDGSTLNSIAPFRSVTVTIHSTKYEVRRTETRHALCLRSPSSWVSYDSCQNREGALL